MVFGLPLSVLTKNEDRKPKAELKIVEKKRLRNKHSRRLKKHLYEKDYSHFDFSDFVF